MRLRLSIGAEAYATEPTRVRAVADEPTHLLLLNPSAGAGRARRLLEEAEAALRARDVAHRLVRTISVEHAVQEAREAAAEGTIPIVMSGDGLIGAVGGALVDSPTPMGVIPGGRGNDFARALGIPTVIADAVDVIAAGQTRTIDVGEANGRRFVCIASCGFDSDANRIANEARFVKGHLVYAYAALRALAQWKPARFTLTLDGEERSFTGYSVAVANTHSYGGGMKIAPGARPEDGSFEVVVSGDVAKRRFLANLPKVFQGTHIHLPEVTTATASEVRVEADRPFAVYADGDHLTDLPADIKVLPGALRVLAPAPSPAATEPAVG
jgi:YegS/Rv2252/BmrU family lipid kinase